MKTRYPEIEIIHQDKGLWRYRIENGFTGPLMGSKSEALAYLDQEAVDYGITSPLFINTTLRSVVCGVISSLRTGIMDTEDAAITLQAAIDAQL